MWYSKQLQRLRRTRRLVKKQQNLLLTMELEGVNALTLHTTTQTLTISVDNEVGLQIANLIREALHDRRRELQAERQQLVQDWHESLVLAKKKLRKT